LPLAAWAKLPPREVAAEAAAPRSKTPSGRIPQPA